MHFHQVETVLKGVVRAERLETPSDFIPAILARVRKEYVQRQYLIREWDDANDFLCKLAMRNGKLLKGGEPDTHSVSINVINDWQRVINILFVLLRLPLFSRSRLSLIVVNNTG